MRVLRLAVPFLLLALLAPRAGLCDEAADDRYLAMVDAARAKPADAQWCEIRQAYPDTTFYLEHSGVELKDKTATVGNLMMTEKTKDAVDTFRDYMRRHTGSLGTHYYAAYLYRWNNDLAGQKMETLLPDFGNGVDYIDGRYEQDAADALLACVAKTGDGRSFKTAYQVISFEEEENIVEKYYHVEPVDISSTRQDGHVYNVVRVMIPDKKMQEANLYFRLDYRFARIGEEKFKALRAKKAAGGAP